MSLQEGRKEGRKGVRRPKEQFRLFRSQYVNCRLLRGIIWGEAPSLLVYVHFACFGVEIGEEKLQIGNLFSSSSSLEL